MREEFLADAESVARRAADRIAAAAHVAVEARGRFCVAFSGGSTPQRMLRLLADTTLPWACVHVFQVDERVAPDGHADRNFAHLRAALLAHLPVAPAGVHAMPVDDPDLEHAAASYATSLRAEAGTPPVLDLVHLGLGDDGHTASLVPNDVALDVVDADVVATAPYQGHRRLTLTYPALDRARELVWVVTGAAKGPALARLRRGDRQIPAGRVCRDRALILADTSANLAAGGA